MQIDWFTVGAQIVNFLVLVYLLKRFLYRPVVSAMTMREQKIAERITEAEHKMLEAERQAKRYEDKQRELDLQRAAVLEEAKRGVEHQRTIMLDQLRQEIEQKRLAWEVDLRKEQDAVIQEIRALIGEKVARISRQLLDDLAGIDLEQFMVRRFLEQLDDLPEEQKQNLIAGLGKEQAATVLTVFPLDNQQRDAIRSRLTELHPDLTLRFQQRAELVCGIGLECSGQLWPWSFNYYLDDLEKSISGILSSQSVNYTQSDEVTRQPSSSQPAD